ncbi:YdeI/OmpD-associated family protein [Maribellus maritimus]|uniref:YdeI/OmpD-associated family protein n=1 Tax=Maribellus maritimus TaxID=2870838 RepID=UPI001EEAF36C|nr:YdeI/OmpD-associated family protein [Maribellus maritimus]MCG6187456.1 YdeI/OmpD-associated family protein [Maribellus maritimus]
MVPSSNAKEIKTLYVSNRKDWRKWLKNNFDKEKSIWLIYPHKDSGKPRIVYNDAVEEALCFGWIDSTIKTYDKNSSMQRFTPRNPKSSFSQQNKERIKWLLENNMLHPSVTETARKIQQEEFIFPDDILERLKSDKTVWENYSRYSDAYKRIRIAYVDIARIRPEEFEKRLNNFIKKTKENKQIGFGGIDKYF